MKTTMAVLVTIYIEVENFDLNTDDSTPELDILNDLLEGYDYEVADVYQIDDESEEE